MKRIQNFIAVTVVGALIGAGVPAMAQDGYHAYGREGMRSQSVDSRYDRQGQVQQNRGFRNDEHGDRQRGDQDRRDYGRGYQDYGRDYSDDRGYGYAPAPVYAPEPVYASPGYGSGYYEPRTHHGRDVAIVGGSAAAGALIGAAAGHGQGAAIGAVIGGIAGLAASAAVDHHHRY